MRFIFFQNPVAVVAWSKAWTVFACSNAVIVGSNATEGMDVYVCIYSVSVISCVRAMQPAAHSPKESYRLSKKRLRNWRRGQDPTKSCRAINEWMKKSFQEQRKLQTIVLLNA
jgi:hypothetical protein